MTNNESGFARQKNDLRWLGGHALMSRLWLCPCRLWAWYQIVAVRKKTCSRFWTTLSNNLVSLSSPCSFSTGWRQAPPSPAAVWQTDRQTRVKYVGPYTTPRRGCSVINIPCSYQRVYQQLSLVTVMGPTKTNVLWWQENTVNAGYTERLRIEL